MEAGEAGLRLPWVSPSITLSPALSDETDVVAVLEADDLHVVAGKSQKKKTMAWHTNESLEIRNE